VLPANSTRNLVSLIDCSVPIAPSALETLYSFQRLGVYISAADISLGANDPTCSRNIAYIFKVVWENPVHREALNIEAM
jgi:hypothetical protein